MAEDFKNPWGPGSSEYEKWQPGSDKNNEYLKWLPSGSGFFQEDNDVQRAEFNRIFGRDKALSNSFDDKPEDFEGMTEGGDGLEGDGFDYQGQSDEVGNMACIPVGRIGKNPDSLPPDAIKLKNYELRFDATVVEDYLAGKCKKTGDEIYTQKAFGKLSLYTLNAQGGKSLLFETKAISGSGKNGCIPNNIYSSNAKPMEYFVGRLISPTNFNDGIFLKQVGEIIFLKRSTLIRFIFTKILLIEENLGFIRLLCRVIYPAQMMVASLHIHLINL